MKTDQTSPKLMNNPFLSLKHRGFRYYWIAQSVSLVGTWMQNISLPWLSLTITKSALLLSIVGVAQYLPMLLFSLFAGALIERLPKKTVILITQAVLMLVSFGFFVLIVTAQIQYWHILVLALLTGFANTFDMPARQSFIIELVGRPDLMNAIGLNSATFNIARIFGPALAGVLMAAVGVGSCFLINGFSFIGILVVLVFIRPKHGGKTEKIRTMNILSDIREGLVYIRKIDPVFVALFFIAIVGTFAINFSVLVPVFATDVLGQEESGFGFLMAVMGIGSLIGALVISVLSRRGPSRFVLVFCPVIIAVCLILTGFTSVYFLSALAIGITGLFLVAFNTTANSTTQFNSENKYRGRVMSVYTLLFAGTTPIGNFFCGIVMHFFGARMGFISCGFIIIGIVFVVFIVKNKFLKAFLKIRIPVKIGNCSATKAPRH
jgi:MFS family permease